MLLDGAGTSRWHVFEPARTLLPPTVGEAFLLFVTALWHAMACRAETQYPVVSNV